MELSNYFCPNEQCKCHGLRAQGNLVKSGFYSKQGEKKQMLKCKICGTRFSETRNTIFFNTHLNTETISGVIRCIAEGNGVRETTRIMQLNKDTVSKIVAKAGAYAEAVMSNLLKNLHLNECQMDELWSFVNKKNDLRRRS